MSQTNKRPPSLEGVAHIFFAPGTNGQLGFTLTGILPLRSTRYPYRILRCLRSFMGFASLNAFYKLSPALSRFLGGQLGRLLFLFLIELLLFLLTGFVFIFLALFFSHCLSPFLWITGSGCEGSLSPPRLVPL